MWTNHFEDDEKGYQVLLSVHNAEKYLDRCFDSLEKSLEGKKWILMYGDDGCTDDSIDKLAAYGYYRSTADKVHLFEYDKAATVGAAKNRLIKEAHKYKDEYPAILMMDADDEMLPERPKMLDTALSQKSSFIVGSWEKRTQDETYLSRGEESSANLTYGPWATLIDCNILPEDGKFFPEDEICNCGFEDVLTWHHLRYIKDLETTVHPSDNPVHRYYKNNSSTSNPDDQNLLESNRNTFWGISELIKNNQRNIMENPPTFEEAYTARATYEKREEKIASASGPLDLPNE